MKLILTAGGHRPRCPPATPSRSRAATAATTSCPAGWPSGHPRRREADRPAPPGAGRPRGPRSTRRRRSWPQLAGLTVRCRRAPVRAAGCSAGHHRRRRRRGHRRRRPGARPSPDRAAQQHQDHRRAHRHRAAAPRGRASCVKVAPNSSGVARQRRGALAQLSARRGASDSGPAPLAAFCEGRAGAPARPGGGRGGSGDGRSRAARRARPSADGPTRAPCGSAERASAPCYRRAQPS